MKIILYEYHQLSDADSSEFEGDMINNSEYNDAAILLKQHHFGLLNDNYTPKPALKYIVNILMDWGLKILIIIILS